MANADRVGTAFVQLQFEFNESQVRRQAQTAADAVQRQLEQTLRGGQGRLTTAAAALGERSGDSFARGLVQRAGAGIKELNTQFQGISSKVSAPIAAGFLGIAGAAGVLVKQGSDAARVLQNLEQGLKAIFGELEGGAPRTEKFISELRELAKASGQSFDALGSAGKGLIATGLSAERTTEILTAFSKAAALSGASTQQFELALFGLSQVQAKGRLSSEELRRQIAENLPGAISVTEVYKQLAEQLDITTSEVIKLQEAGKITADQGIQAILDAINEAPGITQAFEARLQTLDGQLGVLRETLNEVLQLGFRPFVEALAKGFAEIQKSSAFADIQKELSQFSKIIGEELVKAVQVLLPVIPDLVKTFTELTEAVAPLLPEIAEVIRIILELSLPIINLAADILNLILNGLGPLSTIIRELVAGAVFGGLLSLLGKASGALRVIGPLGNAVSRIFGTMSETLTKLAPAVQAVTTAIGLIQEAIEAVLSPLESFINMISKIPGVNIVTGAIKTVTNAAVSAGKAVLGFGADLIGMGDDADKASRPVTKLFSLFGKFRPETQSMFGWVQTIKDGAKEAGKLGDRLSTLADRFKEVNSARDALKDSQEAVADAQDEYNKLLQRGRVDLDAVARAQERYNDTLDRTAEAQERAAEAHDRVGEAIEKEKEALDELREAQTPATAEELAEADDNVTRAKIEAVRATRALFKAQKALNGEEEVGINLAGMSIDQIRTTVAGIRASAAAKRATAKEEGKSEQELAEDVILADIGVRDANRDVTEAEEERQRVQDKGTDKDPEVIASMGAVAQASSNTAAAKRDEAKAIGEVAAAKRDEVAVSGELAALQQGDPQFDEDLADARERIARAKEDEVTAQKDLNAAIAAALFNQQEINRLKIAELALNKDLILQNPAVLNEFVGSFGNLADFVPEGGGLFANIQRAAVMARFSDPAFIRQIATELLTTPGSTLREVLKRLGIPGLMAGGLVTSPMLANIGEFGRAEAVLPLTHPGNFFKTWNASMPYMHPQIKDAFTPTLPKVGTGKQAVSVKPTRSDALLNEILLALQDSNGRATIEAPITVNPAPGMNERMLARQISRKLKRDLRR